MNKIYGKIVLLTAFCIFAFSSCQQPTSDSDNGNGIKHTSGEIEQLKEMYSSYIGEYVAGDDKSFLKSVSIKSDSITLDNIQYSINQNTDLFYENDYNATGREERPTYYLWIKIGSKLYSFCHGIKDTISIDEMFLEGSDENWPYQEVPGSYSYMILKTTDSSSEDSSQELSGSYSYNNASGTQSSGTLTLSDGEWSYSGSKSNPAASSGTYTVSGSKLTVSWKANGYDVSETFTVTTTDSSSTWKSENSYTSTFFSMLFGVTDTQMTFTYSE